MPNIVDTRHTRLAIDQSICILTRPVVITGFNRSLLVSGRLVVNWSIEKNMVDVKILSISYPILLDSINRLDIKYFQALLKMCFMSFYCFKNVK